jgi:hypothetical protein
MLAMRSVPTMGGMWRDLGDDELKARLRQRTADPEVSEALVEKRDEPDVVRLIDVILDDRG